MHRRTIITIALGVAVVGCRQERVKPTEAAQNAVPATHEVSATRVAGGIEITNGGADAITLVVSNRAWLGLLAPCVDPQEGCTRVNPGQKTVVQFANIHGGETGAFNEALVTYWRIVGGKTEELAREIIVPM